MKDIDECVKDIIGKVRVRMPGFDQLLPMGQANLRYELKKVCKECRKLNNDNDK